MSWMAVVPWLSSATLTLAAVTYETQIIEFGIGPWLIFFLVSIFSMGLAVTPTTFISLISGYFLDWSAVVPIVLCYQLASLVGYSLARSVDDHTLTWVQEKFPRSAAIFENVESQPWITTFLARISPVLPFGLMNVVLAISGVRFIPFFFGGLVGMLPRTLFFIWLGSQTSVLIEAIQTKDHWYWSVILSVAGLLGLYKLLFIKR